MMLRRLALIMALVGVGVEVAFIPLFGFPHDAAARTPALTSSQILRSQAAMNFVHGGHGRSRVHIVGPGVGCRAINIMAHVSAEPAYRE